ncbi:flavin reductase family protein [Pseudonocardia sp. GCM10023141]|uniref:flavin reductase family protein n=1 Tax=Pseudonocardia sp. GCM10023141 TaxID=3252653 RepID=UPI00360ABA20
MTAVLDDAPAVGPETFRDVLGRFASGLVLVAADTAAGPVGFTCQSFFSVSLDPPLVAISVRRGSATWEQVAAVGRVAVSVLSAEQDDLAVRFGRAAADKFAGVAWTPGPCGPQLDGALAHLSCVVETVTDAGDHYVVIARVLAVGGRHGHPLLYFRGSFGHFHAAADEAVADTAGTRGPCHTGWGAAPVTRRTT